MDRRSDQTTAGPCGDQLNCHTGPEADLEHAIFGLDIEEVDKPSVVISAFGHQRPSDAPEPPGGSRELPE